MKRTTLAGTAAAIIAVAALLTLPLSGSGSGASTDALADSLQRGNAEPESLSVLTFAPDGTLFIGDSRGAAIFAIATDGEAREPAAIEMHDLTRFRRAGAQFFDDSGVVAVGTKQMS